MFYCYHSFITFWLCPTTYAQTKMSKIWSLNPVLSNPMNKEIIIWTTEERLDTTESSWINIFSTFLISSSCMWTLQIRRDLLNNSYGGKFNNVPWRTGWSTLLSLFDILASPSTLWNLYSNKINKYMLMRLLFQVLKPCKQSVFVCTRILGN